ncbi:MAG TPA: DUF2798 domain-containing protein [Methylophaga aminisulfidivorans]|uniref:DUF2798 domain-containing protein n=2 Tax=root TaxID=1 RepID=A0A7C1VTF5_9GAMM|nr:DUF2798 domain-containing protein [Methylophaga aminisulfidivorans]
MKHRMVFSLLMSFVLTFFMSAWVTYLNVGMIEDFVIFWMHDWFLAWPVAAVISFVSGPRLHAFSNTLIKPKG